MTALIAVERNRRRFLTVWLLVAFALSSHLASAHAILLEASPSANATVVGRSIPIQLRFNVRIEDATQPSPDTLQAMAEGLKAVAYALRGQGLAADGHITKGEIPFNVKN